MKITIPSAWGKLIDQLSTAQKDILFPKNKKPVLFLMQVKWAQTIYMEAYQAASSAESITIEQTKEISLPADLLDNIYVASDTSDNTDVRLFALTNNQN